MNLLQRERVVLLRRLAVPHQEASFAQLPEHIFGVDSGNRAVIPSADEGESLIKIQLIISSELEIRAGAYPCRSSGIVSSIKAILSRLKPPALKLIPPDDRLLKFPASVNPCRSKVPKGFFVFAAFDSLRFSVRFWRKSPPPWRDIERRNKKKLIYFRCRFSKLNGNCFVAESTVGGVEFAYVWAQLLT